MPPVQHSSSSRSAHKDSDQIPVGNMYVLGDYHFALERTSIPGSTNDKIEAICTKINESKSARKSIQIPSGTQLDGWYVEANETEASVYVTVQDTEPHLPVNSTIGSVIAHLVNQYYDRTYTRIGSGDSYAVIYTGGYDVYHNTYTNPLVFSENPEGVWYHCEDTKTPIYTTDLKTSNLIRSHGKDFYYQTGWGIAQGDPPTGKTIQQILDEIIVLDGIESDKLVARFAIDLKDAGGDGPDSDWDDPGDDYDDDYDDYDDTEEYDDELYLELDKWDGEPGESFTVTITGHNGESVVVSVQPNDATEEILTYHLYAPASKDAPLTYTFTTDESWMADGIYSRAFLVTATTDETARTANDGFTLYVEEPDMLTVDINMDEGQPGETITAYVGGHSGHTFSAVVTNAVGDIVATFSHVVPQSQYSDVELSVVLNEAWFSSNSSSETLIITATTDDNRQASAAFKMVLEPLTVSLDVDKYTAEVGEDVTWSMEAEGGNGNYQYNFFIFLDGELVRDGRWQFDNFLTYTPHSPGTYTVEGYAKDSRLSQNVKAPEDGEVIVEGEPEPEPEPEPDEITRTLYITVTGALSGRHNDPGKDSSYSYLPSDKSTKADYGCGGDGGHGGGGGAGASNVVVYKFATDKADSKEITAITKRPGFGSGGGKGGKGGDGCILVYY